MLADSKSQPISIQKLLNPNAFLHPVQETVLMETHISWVILTGDYAYKIKKPVKFSFVDYSTLEKRKHFCDLEVSLNRRFASDLYVGVVPIVEVDAGFQVLGESELAKPGPVVEYAVKMRQFPQDAIVAARLQNPELSTVAVERFGKYLADFHEGIESALPTIECVQPNQITRDALDNFAVVREILPDSERRELLERLEIWTKGQSMRLTEKFRDRLVHCQVRRCHGDLHLKNIVQLNEDLIAFDGIEFNTEFQWVDVLSELAFPVMDFVARGRSDLGWRLLNSYLEVTGDYADLDVLRFYLVYRAMVRAKVTCLNPKNFDMEKQGQGLPVDNMSSEFAGPWDKYLKTAAYFAFQLEPKLAITHGFSGSGKSTVAIRVIEKEGGIRIRSDAERHRMAKRFKTTNEYTKQMSDWVYAYLLELASSTCDAGFPVVIDATFLSQSQRCPFSQHAKQKQLIFEILDCDAPFEVLGKRIRERGPDPSEATVEVLKMQMESHDPLTTDELTFVKRKNA